MKVLIKLGGTLLDEPAKRAQIAKQLAWAARECDLAVVHGGGKQVTRFLEERGVQSQFINGLRVSDENVIDAVTKVIAGAVNKQLVAALLAAGCSAVGLSGVDGGLIKARPLNEQLKFTGKPVGTDAALLNHLIDAGYLPVIACIAGDGEGHIFNVNADQLAVACATGWQADQLFFLTDVPGVKNAGGRVIPRLDPAGVHQLISTGVATAGMQAKLESALAALESGLAEVVIAPGQAENVCRDLLTGVDCGTRIASAKSEVV